MKFFMILTFIFVSSTLAYETSAGDNSDNFNSEIESDPFYNPAEGSEEAASDDVEVEDDVPAEGTHLGRQRSPDFDSKSAAQQYPIKSGRVFKYPVKSPARQIRQEDVPEEQQESAQLQDTKSARQQFGVKTARIQQQQETKTARQQIRYPTKSAPQFQQVEQSAQLQDIKGTRIQRYPVKGALRRYPTKTAPLVQQQQEVEQAAQIRQETKTAPQVQQVEQSAQLQETKSAKIQRYPVKGALRRYPTKTAPLVQQQQEEQIAQVRQETKTAQIRYPVKGALRYPTKGRIQSPSQQIKAPFVQSEVRTAQLNVQEPFVQEQPQFEQESGRLTRYPVRSPSTSARYLGIGRRNPDEDVSAVYPESNSARFSSTQRGDRRQFLLPPRA